MNPPLPTPLTLHPFFLLDEPVVWVDHTLYSIGNSRGESIKPPIPSGVIQQPLHSTGLFYRSEFSPLEEIGPVHQLDLLHVKRSGEVFSRYKEAYIQRTKQSHLRPRDSVLAELCDDALSAFIVGKVLPRLSGETFDEHIQEMIQTPDVRLRMPPNSSSHASSSSSPASSSSSPASSRTILQHKNETPGLRQRRGTRSTQPTHSLHVQDIELPNSISYTPVSETQTARDILKELHLHNAMTESGTTNLTQFFSTGRNSFEQLFPNPFMFLNQKIYTLHSLLPYLETQFQTVTNQADARHYIRGLAHTHQETLLSRIGNLPLETRFKKELTNTLNGILILHGNTLYVPQGGTPIADIANPINAYFEELLQVEAAHEYQEQLSGIVERENLRQRFSHILAQETYQVGNAGFIKTRTGYYVFMDSGSYDLHDGRIHYTFPNARVACHVSGKETSITVQAPVVINTYKHPFLQSHTARQTICLGGFSPNRFNTLSPEERIIALVSKGVEVLKYGYRPSARGYHHLTNVCFDDYKVRR